MSNALRTALDYAAQDQQQEAQLREQAAAQDLWAPTRAYEAGRINNDVNANLTDEASLRNAGRMQEADVLAQQTARLRQRQAPKLCDTRRQPGKDFLFRRSRDLLDKPLIAIVV